MNKENLDFDLIRSDILKQRDMLEQQRQDIKEETETFEITKTDLQVLKEHERIQFDEINKEKELLAQIKTTIESEMELLSEKRRMEGELSDTKTKEDWLIRSVGGIRVQLKHLNQVSNEVFTKNIEVLGQKYIDMLQLNLLLEHKFKEFDKKRKEITNYYDLIQTDKNNIVKVKFDKVVQTEVAWQKLHEQEPCVEKQVLNKREDFKCHVVMQPDFTIQTETIDQQKFKGDKHDLKIKNKYLKTDIDVLVMDKEYEKNKQLSASEQDYFTDKKRSKRDCLRKIWKDTKMERKEIYQMKIMSHEMRNNLEKRLKLINEFVRRPWLQENESLEKELKQELGKDMTSQSDWKIDRTMLDLRHTQLQQLKAQKLTKIVKLSDKEKVLRPKRTTNNDQTLKVNVTTEDVQVKKGEASATMYKEQTKVGEKKAAPETSSGLLSQLQQYYRCCCHCCCKQVCQE
ncbi:uncharacterized protein PF11_0207-like [Gymnodraco acuticeps]|uniref:Uncharacterized protein PF11_0207-like n=1 Tax=Gymnodraco acuticeps TaxID=8218 RepID=A0A6P8TYW5_GYMAC|nr:uncharacterized protein PF11_0207-like [Gymnodraco acuticeps]